MALVALLYNLANKFSHCNKITLLTLFKLNLLSLPLENLNPVWLKPIISSQHTVVALWVIKENLQKGINFKKGKLSLTMFLSKKGRGENYTKWISV